MVLTGAGSRLAAVLICNRRIRKRPAERRLLPEMKPHVRRGKKAKEKRIERAKARLIARKQAA
jgi:hypothetical protein